MAAPATQPASYADIVALPPNIVGEIIHGRLHTHPRHARSSAGLGGSLVGPFDQGRGAPGGWWIFFEPELHLGAPVLVADLAGWRRERLPKLPATAWFDLAPDWVCATVSPATARIHRVREPPRYAPLGAAHTGLVDPDIRTLAYDENREGRGLLPKSFANDAEVSVAPFDAIPSRLADRWARCTPESSRHNASRALRIVRRRCASVCSHHHARRYTRAALS